MRGHGEAEQAPVAHLGHRHWMAYAALAVACLILGGLWAVSSPVGTSADDDFHLASIWCAADDPDLCQLSTDPATGLLRARVPAQIVGEGCFAFKTEASGVCIAALGTNLVDAGTRLNNGEYPGGFYEVLGTLATPRPWVSVVAMRLATLLLVLGTWALALWASPSLRRSQVLAWSVTSIPLGLSLYASTNPSAWAVAGLAALLPAAVALYEAPSTQRRLLAGAAMVAAMLLVLGSRADAALISAAFLMWFALIHTRARRQLPAAAFCIVLAVLGVLTFLGAGQKQALTGRLSAAGEPSRDIALLWSNALDVPSLWAGALGSQWGIGWLDTRMPGIVWVGSMLIVSGLLFVAAQEVSLRKALLAAPVLGMLFMLPWFTLMQSAASVGSYVQPRYLLPLLLLFVGVMLAPLGTRAVSLSATQQAIGASVCTLASSVALHTQIRRYTTGLDLPSPNLDAVVEWWRLPVLTPMGAWVIGTLAGAVIFGIAFWLNGATPPVGLGADADGGGADVQTSVGRPNPVGTHEEP